MERWKDEALVNSLRGHEDLFAFFDLKGAMRELSGKKKGLRPTFYKFTHKLSGPRLVAKDRRSAEANPVSPEEKDRESQRLWSALKDTQIEDTSLRQYCVNEPPRECTVEQFTQDELGRALTFHNAKPLDLIDSERWEHEQEKKKKKASKRRRDDDLPNARPAKKAMRGVDIGAY